MKRHSLSTTVVTLALLPLASLSTLAQQPAADRVEISGTRYDVHALCPAVADDLRRQIARQLSKMPPQALVQVAFHLDGRDIDGIEAQGSSFDARRAIREAVQQIGCDNGNSGRQRVRFDLSYRWDDSAGSGPASARLGMPSVVAISTGR